MLCSVCNPPPVVKKSVGLFCCILWVNIKRDAHKKTALSELNVMVTESLLCTPRLQVLSTALWRKRGTPSCRRLIVSASCTLSCASDWQVRTARRCATGRRTPSTSRWWEASGRPGRQMTAFAKHRNPGSANWRRWGLLESLMTLVSEAAWMNSLCSSVFHTSKPHILIIPYPSPQYNIYHNTKTEKDLEWKCCWHLIITIELWTL